MDWKKNADNHSFWLNFDVQNHPFSAIFGHFCHILDIFRPFLGRYHVHWMDLRFFRYIFWNSRWYFTRGFNWVIILVIWMIFWPFLGNFKVFIWCFLAVLLYFLPFQVIFKAIFCLIITIKRSITLNQQSYTKQSCFHKIFKMPI